MVAWHVRMATGLPPWTSEEKHLSPPGPCAGVRQSGVVRKGRAMQIDTTTEALLCAIKSDVRQRVDDIVDGAEQAAMSLDSERQVEQLLEMALVRVEEAIAEAARAMAREIHRDWDA